MSIVLISLTTLPCRECRLISFTIVSVLTLRTSRWHTPHTCYLLPRDNRRWGWSQCSPVTVNTDTKSVNYEGWWFLLFSFLVNRPSFLPPSSQVQTKRILCRINGMPQHASRARARLPAYTPLILIMQCCTFACLSFSLFFGCIFGRFVLGNEAL